VTKNGKKTKVNTWSIRYRNAQGKRQEEHGFLTEEEGWYRLKEAKKEVEDERLGIRDPRQKNHRKPLTEHLDDFKKAIEDEGVSVEQVKLVTGRVRRILEGCKFNFPPDLCPLALRSYLASLRKDGLSEQTAMHYIRAIKQLTLFLVKHKRLQENPYSGPRKLDHRLSYSDGPAHGGSDGEEAEGPLTSVQVSGRTGRSQGGQDDQRVGRALRRPPDSHPRLEEVPPDRGRGTLRRTGCGPGGLS